jgi:hypothetical protein
MQKIATALVKAQKAFQPALKTSLNPHFRSKYADLSACVEAVIDALNNNGIYLLQKNYDCPDGVMVETVFVHESGEMMECGIVHFPASKKDSQGYASCLTYARRYSLMSACGIAPEDDDGNSASKSVPRIAPTRSDTEISEKRQSVIADVAEAIKERMAAEDVVGAFDEANGVTDTEEKIALWSLLDSKTRSAIKKQAELSKENK